MNRAARITDVERFARDVGGELVTYLLEIGDPRIENAPLLRNAAAWWLDSLATKVRHCIACGGSLTVRQHVGAILLATAAVAEPTSASVCGVCRKCWKDADAGKIERAAAAALSIAVPNARFGGEPP